MYTKKVRKDSFFQKTISILFVGLFFLVPLFFTSVNSELFEFNKTILLYLFTVLIACSWIARMILQRRFIFKRTFFDIPLVLFLASQILSTIFSIDPHTSIFGYYSRFNGSLLSTLCYLLLYWAFVSNCGSKDVHKIIKISLAAAAIVSVYGILEHFGHSFSCLIFQGNFNVDCWIQRVQERVFATLGQPNWLAAYLAILLPLTWWLILSSKLKDQTSKPNSKIRDISYYLLFIIFISCLLFTQSRSGFLGFVLSFVVFWTTVFFVQKGNKKIIFKPFLFLIFALFVLIFFFGSPFPQINKYLHYKSFSTSAPQLPTTNYQSPITSSEDGGISQSSDIRKIVWKGAIDIFKHYPLFGSGVETFAHSYYNFRPVSHNLVSEWDFLYNKAHNEYLNYLATTGALGTITYLGFIISFIFFVSRIIANYIRIKANINEKEFGKIREDVRMNSGEKLALCSGWLSLLVTNFFGFSVVVTSLYFFLIPALTVVLSQPKIQSTEDKAQSGTKNQPILFAFLLCAMFFLLKTVVNYWRADYFYALGQKQTKQNNYVDAYQSLYRAKNLFPNEPVYLGEISVATANLALISNSQNEATATGELSKLAAQYSDQEKKISPKSLNVLKTRVRVFYTLSFIDPAYIKEAISTMMEAIVLAPTDPKLVYNLGLLYAKNGDSDLAIRTIEKAVELKPNYVDARNALALFYEDSGEKEKALEQLQILLKLAPENAAEFQKQIDKLK